ncbi:MAG: sulfite exporter TauE/SafE family protein, partial [Campylobacterales bacterium]|nr:sulfite exporter TauE/SafE family protein [Campylobacterales bacterium]
NISAIMHFYGVYTTMEYITYFFTTFVLSTIFAIAGLGSAVALVPAFNMVGVSFDIARAGGLFVNFTTTITTSFLNFKKNLFDKDFVIPLVISSMLFAFLGSKISLLVDAEIVKTIFGYALFFIASIILFFKKPTKEKSKHNKSILVVVGSIGGFFSGFLGIGGGSIISPILLLFGYDAKKIALGISFVIPFSSIVAFSSYVSVIDVNYLFFGVIAFAAYLGGILGNYMLHFKISTSTVKKILAFSLYIVAIKMLFG